MLRNISALERPTWVRPTKKQLELEYAYEYKLPKRNWSGRAKTIGARFPVFSDFEDFVAQTQSSPIVKATPRYCENVLGMTVLDSIEDIKALVNTYVYPRDVDRIVRGLQSGAKMPMPIVVRGTKDRWILSGNTRSNVALVLKLPLQVIEVQAQSKQTLPTTKSTK